MPGSPAHLHTPAHSTPIPSTTHSSSPITSASPAPNDSDAHALTKESTALARARTNLSYLVSPSAAGRDRPGSLKLRVLLRSLHSLSVFLFWRLYRWAKYALVGSAVAAFGSVVAAGSVASGVGLFLAPTGIVGTVVAGTVWGLGRWGWRRVWRNRRREDVKIGVSVVQGKAYVKEPDLQAVPW